MLDHPLAYIINLKGGENLIEIPERETKNDRFWCLGSSNRIFFYSISSMVWREPENNIICSALPVSSSLAAIQAHSECAWKTCCKHTHTHTQSTCGRILFYRLTVKNKARFPAALKYLVRDEENIIFIFHEIFSGRIECGPHRGIARLRIASKQRIQPFTASRFASLFALRNAFSASSVFRQSGTSASATASHHVDHPDRPRIASSAFDARRNH